MSKRPEPIAKRKYTRRQTTPTVNPYRTTVPAAKPEPEPEPARTYTPPKERVYWDEDEWDKLAESYWRKRQLDPGASPCVLMERAQDVLPEERRRKIVSVSFIKPLLERVKEIDRQLRYKAEALAARKDAPEKSAAEIFDERKDEFIDLFKNEIQPDDLRDSPLWGMFLETVSLADIKNTLLYDELLEKFTKEHGPQTLREAGYSTPQLVGYTVERLLEDVLPRLAPKPQWPAPDLGRVSPPTKFSPPEAPASNGAYHAPAPPAPVTPPAPVNGITYPSRPPAGPLAKRQVTVVGVTPAESKTIFNKCPGFKFTFMDGKRQVLPPDQFALALWLPRMSQDMEREAEFYSKAHPECKVLFQSEGGLPSLMKKIRTLTP